MKIYRLTHTVTILVIIILKFFYPDSGNNISHHLNLLLDSNLNARDGKNVLYFCTILGILLNLLIFDKHKIFITLYYILIILNILLIFFCLKQ